MDYSRSKRQTCVTSAVQRPNNLESTKNRDKKASPSLGRFEMAGILGMSNVLVRWSRKQTESDCCIEDCQVIKHDSVERFIIKVKCTFRIGVNRLFTSDVRTFPVELR